MRLGIWIVNDHPVKIVSDSSARSLSHYGPSLTIPGNTAEVKNDNKSLSRTDSSGHRC